MISDNEFLVSKLSLVEALALPDYKKSSSGIISDRVLLENYFERPWLLSEAANIQARLIIESVWGGFTSLAKWAGGKAIDGAKWAAETGKKLGKGAANVIKKIGGKLGDVFTFVISKLPGGEIILDFLKNTASVLKEKITEMGAFLKETISKWEKTAKKTILDFFINTILPNMKDSTKCDLYDAFGVPCEDVKKAANEMKALGINTITELHWAISVKGLLSEDIVKRSSNFVLSEGKDEEEKNVSVEDVKDLHGAVSTAADDGEAALKVLGFLDNPPSGQEGNIDPVGFVRGKAGQIVEKLFEVLGKLSANNFLKYMQPLFDSVFFDPFESGFGLAAASFMGILTAGDLAFEKLVVFVENITKGLKVGVKKAGKRGTAVRRLFTGDGAELLKDLVVGLVTGSNVEVILRALMGDATQMAEAIKRIIKTMMGAVKAAIKKFGPKVVRDASDGEESEEVEGEVTDALGGYVDDMFPEAA